MDSKKALWKPSEELINNSNMKVFMNYVNSKFQINIENYNELYDWSIKYIANFWETIAEFGDVIFSRNRDSVLSFKNKNFEPENITNYKWFDGAKLNFAENLLRFKDEKIALIHYRENGEPIRLSYIQLFIEVARFSSSLRKSGVKKGDRVAAFTTNNHNAVIAMLATTSIGAIWSSSSPDFGVQGVLDRFAQIEPKILIAVDGYYYNGKIFDSMPTVQKIAQKLPQLEKIIIVNQINSSIPNDNLYINWEDFSDFNAEHIEFEQCDFDHPIYIMYSSGTTGIPKCIVHGAGGTLLQHIKELSLHSNLKRDDKIMYFTTCGWMMWNWLVSSLNIGATVILFDGSPIYPNVGRLWEIAEKEEMSIFGTSPKYLSAIQKEGLIPKNQYDLSNMKTILSTGAPLIEENFKYVYNSIKTDVQLSSISGGTDIISCFMLGNPMLPVYSEEIQCRGLGMNVKAWDDSGKEIIDEKGELVCTAPFPSMPVFFWGDEENKKYHSAYFEDFRGIWRHGDYIKITENGGIVVYGRSDATLNPGGIRIGTAEIYRVVETIDYISDSIVVGQQYNGDTRIILFVIMKNNLKLDENIRKDIKSKIRLNLTPRHVPQIIMQVNDIPHTLNGKKVELAVTKLIHGEEVKNASSLANPESLNQFRNIKFD